MDVEQISRQIDRPRALLTLTMRDCPEGEIGSPATWNEALIIAKRYRELASQAMKLSRLAMAAAGEAENYAFTICDEPLPRA